MGNLHTISSMISNLSLAHSEITPYVRCIVWIAKVAFGSSPFLALISKFTSARFQRVAVYYPLSVWQRCLPAFYASPSIWGYDAVLGLAPLYNLSEVNLCHTSPHVLFMANMFPVNDSKYTGGCEEWFGKLPHTCHHHPLPLLVKLCSFVAVAGKQLDNPWIFCHSTDASVFFAQSALTLA